MYELHFPLLWLVPNCVPAFTSGRLPGFPIPWNGSDNGSCYTATETISFAKDIGFISCFNPVRSHESNGMAEAFVKTFKRDYIYVHERSDAKTVMAQREEWFEDYNEYHPHKGLKMKSPRQFIRAQLRTAFCPV